VFYPFVSNREYLRKVAWRVSRCHNAGNLSVTQLEDIHVIKVVIDFEVQDTYRASVVLKRIFIIDFLNIDLRNSPVFFQFLSYNIDFKYERVGYTEYPYPIINSILRDINKNANIYD